MYRRRSKKQKHDEAMWGIFFGGIMLLAVSVSVKSCDIGASHASHALNEENGSPSAPYFSGNNNMTQAQIIAAKKLGGLGYSMLNARDNYLNKAYSR